MLTWMLMYSAWVDEAPHTLPAVSSRGRWIGSGLAVQVIGVGLPAAYLGVTTRRMTVTGHITAASVRLAWRSDAHTGVGLTVLVTGAVIFAAGSTLMARPFVRRRKTLLVAVPLAALLSVLVFGVLALVVAAIAAGWLEWLDIVGFPSGGGGRGRNRARNDSPPAHAAVVRSAELAAEAETGADDQQSQGDGRRPPLRDQVERGPGGSGASPHQKRSRCE